MTIMMILAIMAIASTDPLDRYPHCSVQESCEEVFCKIIPDLDRYSDSWVYTKYPDVFKVEHSGKNVGHITPYSEVLYTYVIGCEVEGDRTGKVCTIYKTCEM